MKYPKSLQCLIASLAISAVCLSCSSDDALEADDDAQTGIAPSDKDSTPFTDPNTQTPQDPGTSIPEDPKDPVTPEPEEPRDPQDTTPDDPQTPGETDPASPDPLPDAGVSRLGGMTPEDALVYMESTPNLVIIEVTPDDMKFETGFIGAMHIPYDQMDTRYTEVPSEVPVILHCRLGKASVTAYEILSEKRPDIPELSYIAGVPPIDAYNTWYTSTHGE